MASPAAAVEDPVRVGPEAEAEAPVIEARGFDFFYGPRQVLDGISLSIPRHRITAIMGPSGCGKSTFLRSINRMNDRVPGARHAGELLFEGRSVYGADVDVTALRRRVGMVFQRPTPFPFSIFDNVAYGPRMHGVRDRWELRRRVEESLQMTPLWDDVKDRLGASALELSGGQQQMLCIARTLAVRPEVILLDEPTSAIDPVGAAQIEDLLIRLSRQVTIVVVTHNMQQAARISDRTAFFLGGRLVEAGATSDVFHRPRDPRTEAYLTGRFG
jgi:phosphate transport system ATP-binding protein